ncbi:MAG: hypothetical protein WC943_14715 [Elusimicrobiota bacterium]|jgi:hypothetical protein
MTPSQGSEDGFSRRLKALPDLTAPATLLPRVLAAAAAQQSRPWWRKAWWTWPLGMRLAYAGLMALPIVLVLGWFLPLLYAQVPSFQGAGAFLSGFGRTAGAVGRALALVLESFRLPLLAAGLLSYAAAVAAGAAISRLAACSGHHAAVPIPRRMS